MKPFEFDGEKYKQPSIVPLLREIDEVSKKEFRDEVVAKMIKKTRQPDGRCFETFRRINVSAVNH